MILEDVLKNPALRKVLAVGEEQVGKVVGRLLASERVTAGLQGLLTSALHARDTFGRGMQQALHAANLPSREDVAALRERIAELESAIDGLAARVDAPSGRSSGGDGTAFDPAAPGEPPDA
jgi:polyhydroxyalkanoate synthesis regulator phasin